MLSSVLKTYGSKVLIFPKKGIHLHALIADAGFSLETSSSYSWDGIKRGNDRFVLFQFTTGGRGRLRYEHELYDVFPGQAMVLHIPHAHHYYLPGDSESWEFYYLTLYGEEIYRLWQSVEQNRGPVIEFKSDSEVVQLGAFIVGKALKGEIGSSYQSSRYAYDFTMSLLDYCEQTHQESNRNLAVEKVKRYLEDHPERMVSIDEMAAVAGLSRFHFGRLFKTVEGVSPGDYQTNLKMENAINLLSSSHMSIKEISYRLGFGSPTYFCKVFKQKIGMPPNSLRKMGRVVYTKTT